MSRISPELLLEYFKTIQAMGTIRGLARGSCYALLDRKRQDLHDMILAEAKTTRDDKSFTFEFAQLVESLLIKPE